MRAYLIAAVGLLTLAGCQSVAPPAETADDSQDAFVTMIGAERWTVILDRAQEGAYEIPEPSVGVAETDQGRADRAVRDGAAKLLVLRNTLCAKSVLRGDDCKIDWPKWASEPPDPTTPLRVIEQRSDWLSGAMDKFTKIACERGRAASGDELFCSVE